VDEPEGLANLFLLELVSIATFIPTNAITMIPIIAATIATVFLPGEAGNWTG
jgi:hypothetical protein